MDRLFQVGLISQTPSPQITAFMAMRQDYIEEFALERFTIDPECLGGEPNYVMDTKSDTKLLDSDAGELVVENLLKGGRGHFGPIEHPQIVLNVGYFPHTVMQQARTHRISVSFDVQSGRFSGQRICALVGQVAMFNGKDDRCIQAIESVFYVRPVGEYNDRSGKKYEYTEADRLLDLEECWRQAHYYKVKIAAGWAEEHARDLIPYALRQHFVVSFNARSLMHFLDLRAKADAQLEIQQLCELIWPHFEAWMPEVATWYRETRWAKARLSP